jgi:transcriptional regulator with XRE-family HTH domain
MVARDYGMDERTKIGAMIRNIRKSSGMSQMGLSEKIGVSYQQVQKYEYGTSELTISRLKQIADALGVPVRTFIDEIDNPAFAEVIDGRDSGKIIALLKELEGKGLKSMAIQVLEAITEAEGAAGTH